MSRIKIMLILFCTVQLFSASFIFAQNAQIKEIIGTVELKPAGAAAFVPARIGDTVTQNTVISIGLKSSALLTVGSAVLTVRPLTRLTLAEISSSAGTETLNVALQSGRVRVDVNPPAGTRANMSIRSPIATASVRGTSFEFDTKSVRVIGGTVAFSTGRGRTMQVRGGSSSELTTKERATNPLESRAQELLPLQPAGSNSGGRYNRSLSAPAEYSFTFKWL